MVITHLRRIEHRPGDAAARVVDIDDALMHAQTIAETHGADLAVDRRIDDDTRHQTGVQRADVAHRVPDIRRARVDYDVATVPCHFQEYGFRQTASPLLYRKSVVAGKRLLGGCYSGSLRSFSTKKFNI